MMIYISDTLVVTDRKIDMQYHKGLVKHEPEKGNYGDCDRTAIACLLNKHPSEVPHWYGTDELLANNAEKGKALRKEWLRKEGYVDFTVGYKFPYWSPEDFLAAVKDSLDGVYWMFVGKSALNETHVVVCKGQQIIHDPSPVDSGIVGPDKEGLYYISVLLKIED